MHVVGTAGKFARPESVSLNPNRFLEGVRREVEEKARAEGQAIVERARAEIQRERDAALEALKTRYAEAPVAMGVDAKGRLLEVLTDEAGTTWTIMVTQPGGASCIVATGEGWVWRQPKSLDPEA